MDANNYIDSIDFSELIISEEIAKGTFGINFKGEYGNRTVAIKKFNLFGKSDNVLSALRNLRDVRHPNILTLIGDSTNKGEVYSIVEYADGGSLEGFLHNLPLTDYTLNHVVNWALQLCKAVAYLHARHPPMVHGDLRPSNMLLMDNHRVLKISDFQSVRVETSTATNMLTTVRYMAPEVFGDTKPTPQSDVHSCGIIFWEMLSRKRPFENINSALEIMTQCGQGVRPDLNEIQMNYTDEMKKLIVASWKREPIERPYINRFVKVFSDYFDQHGINAADLSI